MKEVRYVQSYLIGYDTEADMIKHYRVDKMLHIAKTDEPREGKDRFKDFDIGVYMKKMFNMYGGREETVKLLCRNDLAGAIMDRFGKDISLIPADEGHFTVNVKVEVSVYFIHWIMALGAKITGPESVVREAKDEIKRLAEQYDE